MPAVGTEATTTWDVYSLVGYERTTTWDTSVLAGIEATTTWDVEGTTDLGECVPKCKPVCESDAFSRINVDHVVEGGTRVTWTIKSTFSDPGPYSYKLQVSDTGNPDAEDWADVGPAVYNAYYLIDPEKRAYGIQLTVHYRVVLYALYETHISRPTSALLNMSKRDWLITREIMREENLRMRQFAGVRGYLFKKNRTAAPCAACVDPYTGDIISTVCASCNGKRCINNYFRAMPCQYADMSQYAFRDEKMPAGPAPSRFDISIWGRFAGVPLLSSYDIWADADTDLRYMIHSVKIEARVRSLPVVQSAELKQLPFDDPAYLIPLEGN